MLTVDDTIAIPDDEFQFTFARASGPGGQNVNKVNSKAMLHWNVATSPSLPEDVRQRFLKQYKTRINQEGELVLYSQQYRDQPKNIDACLEQLRSMILAVRRPPKMRRKSKPTFGSKLRRLKEKKQRSDIKAGRRGGGRRDE
jgi:ribosome-associated protein